MIAIIRKEVNSFFASPMGYLVIALFLLINGLYLWVFSGDYNILDAGFADLSAFFDLAPLILLFLIPAVTMRAFSDEKKMGTLELLLTKPISTVNIILGKYFGAVILIILTLLPTLLYVLTIASLESDTSQWDVGSTIGSYIGLFFLVLAYTAIGIFSSTLSKNQIVAFLAAVFLCFFLYAGFEGLATLVDWDVAFENFGMKAHFDSIARGVLDTRDIIFFLSISILFLTFTLIKLKEE